MTVLLKEALKPNLVQTLEGQPALVHRPFANIAHGNNSLVADRVGLKLGDYLDGVGLRLRHGHGEVLRHNLPDRGAAPSGRGARRDGARAQAPWGRRRRRHSPELEAGAANLARHIGIVRHFGLNAVVAVNRFASDTPAELELMRRLALEHGAYAAEVNTASRRAAEARSPSPRTVVAAADEETDFRFAYADDASIEEKLRAIVTGVYGGEDVFLLKTAREKAAQLEAAGLGRLPICMAKTHLSLSHDAALLNAPTGFTVTVRDLRAYTGAGWILALCGDMQTMPGLGRQPAAFAIDVAADGSTVGAVLRNPAGGAGVGATMGRALLLVAPLASLALAAAQAAAPAPGAAARGCLVTLPNRSPTPTTGPEPSARGFNHGDDRLRAQLYWPRGVGAPACSRTGA